jgi:putative tryptophan/tyrosine transport system substrate-binding protein
MQFNRLKRREFITLLGGAATALPFSVLAEQGKVAKIGGMLLGYPDPSLFVSGLREGLRDFGYEEGRSIEFIVRSADGRLTALASLAADLIGSRVDIIVAYPTTAGLAAKKATAELPIIVLGGDLEATGLIANLARPGGNVTGVSSASDELVAKNLELIAEMLPVARRVAVFVNAASLFGAVLLEHVQVAAQTRNIEVKSFRVREPSEFEADFASFAEWRPDALLIHPALPQKLIADLALQHRLPAVSPNSLFCQAGGLASYSADLGALSRQCATLVDKILKGRKPSDLPAELPTRFRLIVNLRTAKSIGLSLPPMLLGRADEVIE